MIELDRIRLIGLRNKDRLVKNRGGLFQFFTKYNVDYFDKYGINGFYVSFSVPLQLKIKKDDV